MEKFAQEEKDTIANALRLYKADVKKMMTKARRSSASSRPGRSS